VTLAGLVMDSQIGGGKATYLTAGESMHLDSTSVNWNDIDVLGVRATSTLAGGGSIKGVDSAAVETLAPKISINDVCVTEGDGVKAEFTVKLDHTYAYDVKIAYSMMDGSAKDGVGESGPGVPDYATGIGYVTILAGQTEAKVCVPITNDSVYEATEQFTVHLGSAFANIPGDDIAVAICDADGLGTIKNDDAPPAFSINDVCVNEADGCIEFTVTKTGLSAFSHSVDYVVNPGSNPFGAVVGDYLAGPSALSGTLTFDPNGPETQVIKLKIVDDAWYEQTEHFTVDLSNATNNATISDASGLGQIKDNDQPIVIDPLCLTDPHEAQLLGSNWNFELDVIPVGNFVQLANPIDWVNETPGANNGTMEVANDPYGNIHGFTTGEHQWLDTAASPGDVHVSHAADVEPGQHALVEVMVSTQNLEYQGQHYQTPDLASVDFVWDGEVVKTITLDNFKDDDGNIDWNQFHSFQFEVEGQAGADKFEIVAHNQSGAFTGFSIDHVSMLNCLDDDVVVPPVVHPEAKSPGWWGGNGANPTGIQTSEGLSAALKDGSLTFDEFFGLNDGTARTWVDSPGTVAHPSTAYADITLQQATLIGLGGGDSSEPNLPGNETALARQAASAVANFYDNESTFSFKQEYVALRVADGATAASLDTDGEILADLIKVVDDAYEGALGAAYSIDQLTTLLDKTHEI
jgi:hypothetical protein